MPSGFARAPWAQSALLIHLDGAAVRRAAKPPKSKRCRFANRDYGTRGASCGADAGAGRCAAHVKQKSLCSCVRWRACALTRTSFAPIPQAMIDPQLSQISASLITAPPACASCRLWRHQSSRAGFFQSPALACQFAPLPSKLDKGGAHRVVSGHCGHLVAISRTLKVLLYLGAHAIAFGGPNRAIETRTAQQVAGFRPRTLGEPGAKSETPRRRRDRRHRSGA
jgi:hypothetical protein